MRSTCRATGRALGSSWAPAVRRWASRACARSRSSGGCSPGSTPTPVSSSAVPPAATRCRPGTWCCGRSRTWPSCMPWVTSAPAGRPGTPTRSGWRPRSATWMGRSGPARAGMGRSMSRGRGWWRSGSPTGSAGPGTRCPIPTWSSSTAPRAPTAAGGPWTAETCSPIARPPTLSTGPPTSTSCRAPSAFGGRSRIAGAIAPSRECPLSWSGRSPSGTSRSAPSLSGWSAKRASSQPVSSFSTWRMPPGRPRPTTLPRPCTAAGRPRRASTATTPSGWWPRSPAAPNASQRQTGRPSLVRSTSSPPPTA
jgi:hypothetical protein